ncbi:MAG: hypothetical protein LBU05_03940, partial [Bifidobacteriaceae bacterium]|nr:hypothetical protein [Bifidobacteriaceae bacterium]
MAPDLAARLTDWTRCPDCGAKLASRRCSACGLAMGGPAGAKLANLSIAAAAARRAGSTAASHLLDERAALIERLRGQ